ncbi:MAG: hypothetical protein GX811_04570, partial [Lentisphaerae bacterium]|nr:hypothetical protein [Lentisphaerota bacterium]
NVYYIFFPDPWPKNRHYERRLFSKSFIEDLSATLVPGGLVHVATDSVEYFKEIEGLFNDNPSFRKASPLIPADHERTEFEELFTGQGETIGRCSFSLSV